MTRVLTRNTQLFKTKMLSAEVLAAVSQDRQAFYAFQRYMCDANVLHGVLKWSEHSDVHRVEFQVLSYPPQGIEALWHIALTSEHSSVVELAAALTQRLASRAEYLAACIVSDSIFSCMRLLTRVTSIDWPKHVPMSPASQQRCNNWSAC